jgi:hypothetical protein
MTFRSEASGTLPGGAAAVPPSHEAVIDTIEALVSPLQARGFTKPRTS